MSPNTCIEILFGRLPLPQYGIKAYNTLRRALFVVTMALAAQDDNFLTQEAVTIAYDRAYSGEEGGKPLPDGARSVTELAKLITPIRNEHATIFKCNGCDSTYKMRQWAAKHVVEKHMTEDEEKLHYCAICCTNINHKVEETPHAALKRHNESKPHTTAKAYPTLKANKDKTLMPFCPNDKCHRMFSSAASGRKHFERCKHWTEEKRESIKARYLSEEEAMKRRRALARNFNPMPWDMTEEIMPETQDDASDTVLNEMLSELANEIKTEAVDDTKETVTETYDGPEDKENTPHRQKRRKVARKPKKKVSPNV